MTLDQIALSCKTDKASNGHNYTPIYASFLEPLRDQPLVVLELGIGGYQYKDRGGESLRMWEAYLPHATIHGVDCYDKENMATNRVTIHKGRQDDPEFLTKLIEQIGPPDVIIDDASHVCPLTITAFETLFPLLKPGGLYLCEDVHTSFWLDYQGDPDPKSPTLTTVKFFQQLTPQLSNDTLLEEHRTSYAGYLEAIHFYRNLVIIKKR
jgi:hypothetical protein